MSERRGPITQLLDDLRGADRREVLERLTPLVYDELRDLADARLAREHPDHTLRPTALVHEAYLRLLGGDGTAWADRQHFFHAAAQAMRRILVDHARRRGRLKRGGGRVHVTLGDVESRGGVPLEDMLALDRALDLLQRWDERMHQVVQLRFFGGLSVAETAEALGLSERTVKREWAVARAWLYRAIHDPGGAEPDPEAG